MSLETHGWHTHKPRWDSKRPKLSTTQSIQINRNTTAHTFIHTQHDGEMVSEWHRACATATANLTATERDTAQQQRAIDPRNPLHTRKKHTKIAVHRATHLCCCESANRCRAFANFARSDQRKSAMPSSGYVAVDFTHNFQLIMHNFFSALISNNLSVLILFV